MVKTNMTNIVWSGGEYRTKCVIGLERDGVLNEWIEHCRRPEDFKAIKGSFEAVAQLRNKGYKIAIITDQRGVESGVMTKEDVEAVNVELMTQLGNAGCSDIDGMYYSIGINKQDPFVKPNTGMFKRCQEQCKDIVFNKGYYVGHTIKDLKAAMNIGARPVLVRTGKGKETEQELNRWAYKKIKEKTLIFDDLDAFAKSLK